jgi:membrane associated rhomboid family serine protease
MNGHEYHITVPSLTWFNKRFLIISGCIFILHSFLQLFHVFSPSAFYFPFIPTKVFSGEVFRFILFPFHNTDFFSLLFDGLVLWFVGSEIELLWGRYRYLMFFLFVTVMSASLYCLVGLMGKWTQPMLSHPLVGPQGFTYALLLIYGLIFRDRYLTFMLFFPLKAKYFCMLIIGIQVYLSIFSQYRWGAIGHVFHLLSAGLYFVWRYSTWGRPAVLMDYFLSKRKKKERKHLRLVKGESQGFSGLQDDSEDFSEKKGPKGPKFWQ